MPMAAGKRAGGPGGGSATWYFRVGAAGHDDDDDDLHGGVSSPRAGKAPPAVRPGGALYTSSRDGKKNGARSRRSSERRQMEQSHHRSVATRGGAAAGLFYFDEGGIQDRLRGPGYKREEGKMYSNAVLGLKPLQVGPTGDQEKVERHEIARLAGWDGRLQLMEEQRAREKAASLAAPPVGVGCTASGSAAAAAATAPPVFSPPPPIASKRDFLSTGRDDKGEMDPVARADAMVRGDSVYSELESKYRSV